MSQDDQPLTFEQVFSEVHLRSIFDDRLKDAKFTGLDGISVSSFKQNIDAEVTLISRKVLGGKFEFTRFREKLILKTARKPPRQISIPTIRDAIALRALCDHLTFQFHECRMRPPHDCTKRVAQAAKEAAASDSFLRMDVVNFYPSVDHDILVNQLRDKGADERAISLIEKAIKNPTGFDEGDKSKIGVPQGLSISNILSMLYLEGFDHHFAQKYRYFRYVDDVLLVVGEEEAVGIHDEIASHMRTELRLTTHELDPKRPDKTAITPVKLGTEYLGYHISSGGLRIRERSYKKMFRAVVGCLRALKGDARVDQVLWRLNLIITGCRVEERSVGWVFFFRQSTDVGQFHRMDAFVRKQLTLYGLKDQVSSVKRFAKAYHETRFNRDGTTYIPDFDNFSLADMMKAIHLVKGISLEKLGSMDRSEVEGIYWRMVKREVAKLERETMDFLTSGS